MKTNSLRIGNYVLCAGKVIAVTSVFPKGINAHTDRITGKVSYIPADRIGDQAKLTGGDDNADET